MTIASPMATRTVARRWLGGTRTSLLEHPRAEIGDEMSTPPREEPMNEFLILFEMVESLGFIYLLLLLSLAAGLFVFDGRPKRKARADDSTSSQERMAA
jgi:hypothetical protein